MTKIINYTITFLTADTLTNLFTQETEEYQFETEFKNIIIKIVGADESVKYDLFTVPIDQEITLEDFLKKKLKENKKYLVKQKKELWYAPDTGEKLTLQKVEDDIADNLLKILMNKDKHI